MHNPLRRLAAPFVALGVLLAASWSIQPAWAGATSNYLQNKLIDQLFRAQAYTFPTSMYVGLSTTAPSAAACGTEVSGSNYSRVAVTGSLANWAGTQGAGTTTASTGTTGLTSNNGTILFPTPSATWGTVVAMCVFDASTSGNLLWYATLTTSKTVNSGDTVSFAAAALTFTLN